MNNFKKCPICGETNTTDTGRLTKYKITNWATHIKGRARSELFNREFSEEKIETPHVDWLKKNAKIIKKVEAKIVINL